MSMCCLCCSVVCPYACVCCGCCSIEVVHYPLPIRVLCLHTSTSSPCTASNFYFYLCVSLVVAQVGTTYLGFVGGRAPKVTLKCSLIVVLLSFIRQGQNLVDEL